MNNFLYFDYASTTPVDQRVLLAMEPYWYKQYGNPSSLHQLGLVGKKVLDDCRVQIKEWLGVTNGKIVFTGGGSEGNNLALLGVARANQDKGRHIIISAIEHKSVLYPVKYLESQGWEVDVCPVDQEGLLDLSVLEKLVKKDTALVSVIYANNEIGTVQDLLAISNVVKKNNSDVYLHADACQAINYLELDMVKLGVDLLTFNGSKCYGPKGVGGLYIGSDVKIEPLMYGGGQEYGLRPGTENVPLIVGMTEAIKISRQIYKEEARRLYLLRQKIISTVEKKVEGSRLNGSRKNSLPNIINFSLAGAEGESLVLYLDDEGCGVSTGSACSASDLDPSHVLLAIGRTREEAHTSLRISLGRWTSEAAVDQLLVVLPKVIDKVRLMSAI